MDIRGVNFMYKKNITIFLYFFIILLMILSVACAEDNGDFGFVVMGCIHLGACDSLDYELTINKIKEYKPNFVLSLGGMANTIEEKTADSSQNKSDFLTSKLGIPNYNISGTCRMSSLSLQKDMDLSLEKRPLDSHKELYYAFEHKNNLFICLDSDNLFNKNHRGLVDYDQIVFLKRTLSKANKYANVFLTLHGAVWIQTNSVAWFRFIHPTIKNKVKYVFGTNAHYIDLMKKDGVTYITTGVPPCHTRKTLKKPCFPHFLIVKVNNTTTSIEIVPLQSFPIENIAILKEEKTADSITPNIIKPFRISSLERLSILKPPDIIKRLDIQEGMHILDIGAGTGLFTFKFADALNATGKVFATEIDEEMVKLLKNKTEEKGYKNIFPVYVNTDGLDQFYKRHIFDIIFLSETYQALSNPEKYFRELRPSLKENTGRLYIIHFRNNPYFSEMEFDDFKNVMETLISEKESFPLFRKLSKEIQQFTKDWKNGSIPQEIRKKATEDFNKMLLDRFLFNDLLNYYGVKEKMTNQDRSWHKLYSHLDARNLRLAKWLIVELDEKGYFDKRNSSVNDNYKKELLRLNRILITGIFQSDKLEFFKSEHPYYAEKNSILSVMNSAGYEFVREDDFLTQYYFLEFKRRD